MMPIPLRYVFQKPFAFPPDTVWTYNGGSSDLLGKVIEKASGMPIDAFAREALFEPLGITDWQLMNYRNGKLATAAGLRLRPRDAAKIGQLVLNKGNWNGRQIVSAEWIAESIKPRFQAINMFGGLFYYGYQWWIGRTLAGDKDVTWIAGQGLGGQRLYIVPDLELVVMVNSGTLSERTAGPGRARYSLQLRHPGCARQQQPLKFQHRKATSHDIALYRRRHDHPPHHRAGRPVHRRRST